MGNRDFGTSLTQARRERCEGNFLGLLSRRHAGAWSLVRRPFRHFRNLWRAIRGRQALAKGGRTTGQQVIPVGSPLYCPSTTRFIPSQMEADIVLGPITRNREAVTATPSYHRTFEIDARRIVTTLLSEFSVGDLPGAFGHLVVPNSEVVEPIRRVNPASGPQCPSLEIRVLPSHKWGEQDFPCGLGLDKHRVARNY